MLLFQILLVISMVCVTVVLLMGAIFAVCEITDYIRSRRDDED